MCTPGSPGGLVTKALRRSLTTPTAELRETSYFLLYIYGIVVGSLNVFGLKVYWNSVLFLAQLKKCLDS